MLTAVATAVTGFAGLGIARRVATAAARAVLQLAVVSVVIVAVVQSLWLSLGFVLVMLDGCGGDVGPRMTPHRSGLLAGVPIAAGAAPYRDRRPDQGGPDDRHRAGAGVRDRDRWCDDGDLAGGAPGPRRAGHRHGEYEAALSLGLTERDAATELIRPAARQALVPATDQTRTVGLVTLPGAFVGV